MMGIEDLGWRKKRKTLWATPIYKSEFPKLYKCLLADKLRFEFDSNTLQGYQWYLGKYPIAPKAIKNVWGLTDGQYSRFVDWIVSHVEEIGGV